MDMIIGMELELLRTLRFPLLWLAGVPLESEGRKKGNLFGFIVVCTKYDIHDMMEV